jgi:hypothetical protein
MTSIDRDTLMAFIDGELNEERAAEVEAALTADPALRASLLEMQDTDNLLRAAITPSLEVPERLARLLEPKPASNVAPLKPERAAKWWIPAGAAVAATLAIWFAGSSVMPAQTAGWLRNTEGGVAITGAVEVAARTAPSGELVRAGSLGIRPVVSFVANDGRSCRELHVRDRDTAARIIGCRDLNDDEWRVEALASTPAQDFPDTYQTAAAPRNPVIDAAFARIGVKSTMGANEENAAIARKWTRAPR